MHTIYARINNVTALLSSCLLALLAAISISSYVLQPGVDGGRIEAKPIKVMWGQSARYRAQEWAFVRFDLQADLRPLFAWNTKQVFVSVSADYKNAQGIDTNVVLWDRIIRRKVDAKLSLEGARNKYTFKELSRTFKNSSDVDVSLNYYIMPYVGLLTSGTAGKTTNPFRLPPMQRSS